MDNIPEITKIYCYLDYFSQKMTRNYSIYIYDKSILKTKLECANKIYAEKSNNGEIYVIDVEIIKPKINIVDVEIVKTQNGKNQIINSSNQI